MKAALKWVVKRAGVSRESGAAMRMWFDRQTLALAPRRGGRTTGRVLCYHSVGQPQSGTNDVAPAMFRRHIETALARGYKFVPARHIAETGGAANELAITFDDAWISVLEQAAPVLKEHAIPWTVFAVSSWCHHEPEWTRTNILSWKEIQRVADYGGDIGCHSVTHPDFGKLTHEDAVGELERSRDWIKRELGFTPIEFAIPFGQSMNWPPAVHEAARAAGYEYIYAQAEETRPPGTIARTFITKFDDERIYQAALEGAYDRWEEWI